MSAESQVRAAVLREQLGEGPAYLVLPPSPGQGLTVWVANQWIPLTPAHSMLPRVDLACMRIADNGEVMAQVVQGVPSHSPPAPCTPYGWLSLATIRVNPCVATIGQRDITDG